MKKLKKLIYKKRTVLEEFLSVIENQCTVWEPIQPRYLFSLLWIEMKMKKTHFYCSEKRLTAMISILELSLWISNFCLFFFFFFLGLCIDECSVNLTVQKQKKLRQKLAQQQLKCHSNTSKQEMEMEMFVFDCLCQFYHFIDILNLRNTKI